VHTTSINRTLALPGFAPAGKLRHAHCSFLPVLALYVATAAWSQTLPSFTGSHGPPDISIAATSANPTADTPASARYKFMTIGPKDSQNAYAEGINNAGLVTGFYEDSSSDYHGFVWQNGTFQKVDYPGAVDTFLYGVNNLGVAIGSYGDGFSGPEHAVTYSVQSGTWTALPDIPNQSLNFGYGINDAGVAVGDTLGVAWIWHPTKLSYSFLMCPERSRTAHFPSASMVRDRS